jgi:hypothetical protein
MNISKAQEKVLRREFATLKRRIHKQEKDNLLFLKSKCWHLLSTCKRRWDVIPRDIFDFTIDDSIDGFLHDLRNS